MLDWIREMVWWNQMAVDDQKKKRVHADAISGREQTVASRRSTDTTSGRGRKAGA